MKYAKNMAVFALSGCLIVAAVSAAAAQESWDYLAVATVQQACPVGETMRGDLGISGFECNCSFSIFEEGDRVWRFRSEPVILGVRERGISAGKLRVGDVITAIDGLLITTSEGGHRFANVRPGEQITLTVRRGERIARVELEAGSRCEHIHVEVEPMVDVEPVVGVWVPEVVVVPEPLVGVLVEPRVDVSAVVAPVVAALFPGGWFGFGIRCNCVVDVQGSGTHPVWQFKEPPEVYSVERGTPAEEAGMQRGDVLLEIDGVTLVSEEGGRRFGAVEAGQTVTFTYQRGGETREATVTAVQRVGPDAVPVPDEAEIEALIRQMQERQHRQQQLYGLLLAQGDTLLEEGELAQGLELLRAEGDTELEEGEAMLEGLLAREIEEQQGLHEELERFMLGLTPPPAPLLDEPIADQLRFTGTVGDVAVEVWGGSSVIATVIEEGRDIVIVTRDARIRIRRSK